MAARRATAYLQRDRDDRNTMPHARTLAPYAVERFATPDASAWQLLPPG